MINMHSLLFHIFFLLSLLSNATAAPSYRPAGCPSRCGNVEIPYPFGIGPYCSLNSHFEIICLNSSNPPKPYFFFHQFEVVNISETQIYVKNATQQLAMACYGMTQHPHDTNINLDFSDSPYTFSDSNQITVVGCDDLALVQSNNSYTNGSVAIVSYCTPSNSEYSGRIGSCADTYGCCRAVVSKGDRLIVQLMDAHSIWWQRKIFDCSLAFVGIDGLDFTFPLINLNDPKTFQNSKEFMDKPLVLDWRIIDRNCTTLNSSHSLCGKNSFCIDLDDSFRGSRCMCNKGYKGNPYLHSGCQDINECNNNPCSPNQTCINAPGSYNCSCPDGYYAVGRKSGTSCLLVPRVSHSHSKLTIVLCLGIGMGLLLLSTCFWLYKFMKKRKIKRRKEKFFKRNGGLLLRQQISTDECILEKTRLFTIKELEIATDLFNESRILGRGGQGTVYKGMLSDGKIVAIKKSKKVDENQAGQFTNEVVMLSQIIHRNVVKLLGCCLEAEVPLLVYEFIPNGTLFDLIHDESHEFPFSWNMRLKVAVEVAESLAYLHSATSIPIYHRDIKSTNILLDEKYVAKISDFGISRSITVDQTHLTTMVKGTFGYLDPEYFQSSQFTEKSDVYSFAIVLVELLTGQRPISLDRTEEERSLATRFLLCMERKQPEAILDIQVLEQDKIEELNAVAKLAQRCLNLNGKKRPTMKEVAMELESIRMGQILSSASDTIPQGVHLCKSKSIMTSDDDYTWTNTDDNIISSSSTSPLKIHTY
ncbi:wall-associated receptor kinase-like 1 [Olea europaea var. sylvestris]|uniref:wall-associated receptor kinase-like 1 n=1 Tax=Olea europaea var. sylvestris TaxID=158386 RepID=UPI000C1CD436|nr:wall-associated receptor kinase-like 1 [Olea europaea var. sylvestris]